MQQKRETQLIGLLLVALLVACFVTTGAVAQQLVLNDSLQGSTSGTFVGGSGQFAGGGWKITSRYDSIYWHLPYPVYKGAAEFYISGLNPQESRPGLTDKSELFHMYDWTYGSSDTSYSSYRDNPSKHFIRKTGTDGAYNNTIDALELVLVLAPNYQEPNSPILSWDPGTTYLFREEWNQDADGNCVINTYRDGNLVSSMAEPGSWSPNGHSIKIGAARVNEWAGAPLDAVFSYVKVWDMEASIPGTPVVTYPMYSKSVNTATPRIRWAWTPSFNRYQVRLTSGATPDTGIVFDSGEVMSVHNYVDAANLSNGNSYYVWVRLGNGIGWTGWSASNHWFRVDTAYQAPNYGNVQIVGNSMQDSSGPFVGLGFTYMEGLGFCKNDRERFESDLAFMSSRGFNFMRILSEVPGACDLCWWYGRGIHASNFTCQHGNPGTAWSDYDQQFRDMVDIAYDKYGVRSEVTIFGGAGDSFPTYVGREAHCQRILNLLVGREHKVAFIEVANEAWQTGFDYPQGVTDLRNLGQYLAARTTIPIALSSPPWGSYPDPNDALVELYGGSAADIATEHFERDLNTFKGGWLPVRDCWRVVGIPGIPPCSSDEPIGPGSSVMSEEDPIKLVSAACFAWIAKLPSYVFHSNPGVRGDYRFEDMGGVNDYKYIRGIIPGDVASWTRNDGLEAAAPFTAYCNGVANQYWTSNPGASTGCHRNIGGKKGCQFICYPQGILGGGVTLQARQWMTFTVYNPLTGAVVLGPVTKNTGETVVLGQGPGAYIIKGSMSSDVTPPGQVTGFSASGQGMHIGLSWTNPGGDFAGVRILAKTNTYPVNENDGALVYAGAAASCVHSGITGGITYYYSAFTYDACLNYSARTTTSVATPVAVCYADEFNYPDGALNGNGGWNGSAAGSQIEIASQMIRLWGGAGVYDAIKTVNCSAQGAYIPVSIKAYAGNGARYIWGVWIDDTSGLNLARWYGTANAARGRIGGTGDVTAELPLQAGWNTLLVRIYTAANTSQFFLNGADIGTLSHASQGSGNVVGRVRIERMDNWEAAGHQLYFDDLLIGEIGGDVTPPGPVTSFIATSGDTQNTLTWTNPGSDFTGTLIRFKTTGFPTSPTDGTQIYNNTGTSTTHTGLTNGVTYYYSAWAHDAVPNYSSKADASATPTGYGYCFQDEFNYSNGALSGQGGWTGTATASHITIESQAVKVLGGAGSYDAIKTLSCAADGTGYTTVNCRINGEVGYTTMWSLWMDDPAGLNLARWYGTGMSARGRIGITGTVTADQPLSGAWQDLKVKIHPANNTTEFFFNSVSLGVYSHAVTGAGNTLGRLRFERMDAPAAGSDSLYFDNLSVGEVGIPPDTTPPGPVTAFGAVAGDTQNALSWTNPGDADFAGTMVRFKTTGYPTGPTDGTQVYSGAGTSTVHSGLMNGVIYYYAAYAFDEVPNYSTAAQTMGTPMDVTPPGPVTGFAATPSDGQNALAWTNPGGDFTGTVVVFKTTGYPTSAADGTQIYDGAGTSYNHTSLTSGVTYYYCAYAHDEVPNYSTAAQTSGTPIDNTPPGPVTGFTATRGDTQNSLVWNNPGDADFVGVKIMFKTTGYPTSATDGTQCYSGTGTSTMHTGLNNGTAYYYKAFAYDEVPNYATGAQATATPADVTAPGPVIGFAATRGDMQNSLTWANPGDADLAGVMIRFKTTGYPTGPTDGTQCFNASGTSYNHTGLTNGVTYYYCAYAKDEVPNYSAAAQANGIPADTTAPGPVTGFTATPSGTQNALAWANPGGDCTGTLIRWKTTGYPTGPTDGTLLYDSSGTSTTHTGLTAGVTYYYCAYAHDEVPNYAAVAQASGTIPAAFCFQDEFNYAEGVALVGQGGWTGTATNAHIKCTSNFVQVYGGATAKNATKTMTCSGAPYIWVRLIAYQGVGTQTMWNVWINDSTGKNFARWYGAGTTARGRIGTTGTVTAVKNLTGGGLWDSLVVKIDPTANTSQFFFNGEDLGVYSHGTQPNNVVSQIKIERENNGGAAGSHMFLDNIRVGPN